MTAVVGLVILAVIAINVHEWRRPRRLVPTVALLGAYTFLGVVRDSAGWWVLVGMTLTEVVRLTARSETPA